MARILALLLGSAGLFGLAGQPSQAQQVHTAAQQLREKARKAEKSGDQVNAYLFYSQAAGIDAADGSSWAKAVALKAQALAAVESAQAVKDEAAGKQPAPASAAAAAAVPPAAPVPAPEDVLAARQMRAPLRLRPMPGRRSFDLRGDSKSVIKDTLRPFGIEVIFDADLQPLANFRFHLENEVGFAEAAEALQLATGTFLIPIGDRMALVAKDAPNKRQELEHTIAVAVPLPTATTVQDAQELARAVQSLMEIQKFGVDPNQRMVVIRDRESKVLPALALFNDLIRHRAQVMVEVELLEASESAENTYGLQLPTRYPLAWLSRVWNSVRTFPAGSSDFLTFGGGYSFIGLGISSSQLFATFSRSNTRTLSRVQLRGLEGQAMNFHLGDKYPVMTAGYFGNTGGASGQVYTPPPTFNFEDLGVVLKITPRVHDETQVSLEIEAEYKVLTGQALNDIPVIANRGFKASARVAMGETAVIAGLLRANEARTVSGIAGLATLPAIGHLFSQRTSTKDEGQALLVIRPHILNLPPSILATRTVHTGTDGRPRIRI